MKILGLILAVLIVLVLIAAASAYAIGSRLPLNHIASVTGEVPASPEKVFARIADYAHGKDWRSAVQSVTVLPPDNGRARWTEDVGHGQKMTFLALRSESPTLREVQLDDPNATYGGTWLYELSPGPTPNTTTIKITETGYINPPLYRFMMAHIMGPTRNLDQYLTDLKAAAARNR